MYVCMYVCVCVYMYTINGMRVQLVVLYVCIHICMYMYVCMYVRMYASMYMCETARNGNPCLHTYINIYNVCTRIMYTCMHM